MSEIRERLEEIRRLTRGFLSADVMDEIHQNATEALALLEEAEPVAWKVEERWWGGRWTDWQPPVGLRPHGITTKEPPEWSEADADYHKGRHERRVTPLYTSPTPTQATALTSQEEDDEPA